MSGYKISNSSDTNVNAIFCVYKDAFWENEPYFVCYKGNFMRKGLTEKELKAEFVASD